MQHFVPKSVGSGERRKTLTMKKFISKYSRWITVLGLLVVATTVVIAVNTGVHREIQRTTEQEVVMRIESLFGNLFISRGDPAKILSADIRFDGNNKAKTNIRYDVRNSIGYLDIDLNKGDKSQSGDEENIQLSDIETGRWYLRLTDAIPIRLNAELACGKGEFDITGLQMKDFKLSTGASSVILRCNEANRSEIENLRIESGVGRLVAEGLGNTNFRRLKFSGGVGSYDLDFSGKLRTDAEVDIDVGLGAITITIPDNIGAKVICDESWISKIHLDAAFVEHEDNTYYTDNYSSAAGRLKVSVQAGLGSVRIQRGSR
jgi:hypothetical protein